MRILSANPLNAETPLERLREDITPRSQLFVRSHFPMPNLDRRRYVLVVAGAVAQAREFTVADLEAMPSDTFAVTLECAGNGRTGLSPLPAGEQWGLGAVGTARWTGVRLGALLESAGLKPEVREILAVGADRGSPPDLAEEIPFARSLPLEKAMDPGILLAVQMNDEPISAEHGGPVRLVVPGWYGVASVKWLERIEALADPFRGYYQARRYVYDQRDGGPSTPLSTMRVRSLITAPLDGETIHRGRLIVRGKAWSGDGRVVRVQMSVDGAEVSPNATLFAPLSSRAWRSWEFAWDAAPGRHVLRSFATDEKGNRQPEVGLWNWHGYANNAAQAVVVTIA